MPLHPRNKHTGRYDFKKLIESFPKLAPYVVPNAHKDLSIDFSDPLAVRILNRALLKHFYGLNFWEIPQDFLCPPIPGRSDYIHHAADLLASSNGGTIPRGPQVKVLDIGVGASCIYPIIGNREYGWSFLGSEIDPSALVSAERIVESNPELVGTIEIRKQPSPGKILNGLLTPHEEFDLVICNPPFHSSLHQAQEGSRRKWRNLGREAANEGKAPLLNFGGKGAELWCPGGEVGFIGRMIQESREFSKKILWFSALVSNKDVLPEIHRMLDEAWVDEFRTVDMEQGQKVSRFVAWTFMKHGSKQ